MPVRATDEVRGASADTSGWSYTYGMRYFGLRGMRWVKRVDGTWERWPRQCWRYVVLDGSPIPGFPRHALCVPWRYEAV